MRRYDTIKAICKKKGIKITKMEADLGFSKGSLSKIDKNEPSAERVQKIAEYLDIEPSVVLNGASSPVYDVAAGEGRINDGVPDMYTPLQDIDGDCYVKVHGDSMYPTLHNNDILKFKEETVDISPSDFTVIQIDGEAVTVKHVEFMNDGIWVRAENKEVFPDRFYTTKEVLTIPVRVIGKATSIVCREL